MRGIKSMWLELRYPRSRLCLFSFIYRPTSTDASFPERMDLMLTKVDCKNYWSCMLGDFSIDLFSKSALHKRFIALAKAMFRLIVMIMFSSQGPYCFKL